MIYSVNIDLHLQHLREVLIVLSREKFYAAIAKCSFMINHVLFLGYVVSKDGLSVDESKVIVVKQWPIPTTVHEVLIQSTRVNRKRKRKKMKTLCSS